MVNRGTRETRGEKGPDSAESESRIHGLVEGEGASSSDGYLHRLAQYMGAVTSMLPNVAKYDMNISQNDLFKKY